MCFLSVFRWTETLLFKILYRHKRSKYDTCLFRGMFGKYTLISTTPKYLTTRILNHRKGKNIAVLGQSHSIYHLTKYLKCVIILHSRVLKYNYIIGVCYQRGHWDLVARF